MAVPASAAELRGRVVGVHDGDTLTLLTAEKEQIKVRLAEIDTPESAQPYGSKAKQALSDQVFNKEIRIETHGTDRYGRTIGTIFVGERNINRYLVQEGHAWVYRQYLRDRSLLDEEEGARRAGRGLWALPEAQRTPPWEWRRAHKPTAKLVPKAAAGPGVFKVSGVVGKLPPESARVCGAKQYCKQMASCEEARWYLEQCGLKQLDRNGDGVPCEQLCRDP